MQRSCRAPGPLGGLVDADSHQQADQRAGQSQTKDQAGGGNAQVGVAVGQLKHRASGSDAQDAGEGQEQPGQGFHRHGAASGDRTDIRAAEALLVEALLQLLFIGDPIDEQHPLQVVHLVLNTTGQQTIGLETLRAAHLIAEADLNNAGAHHIEIDTRDAQAAFFVGADGAALGGESGDGSAVDKAQPIVAGVVVAPGQELTGGNSSLPPLALISATAVPRAIASLPAAQQAARYAAMAGNDPELLVKMGAAYQRAGDPDGAAAAYNKALAADPNSLEAKIGLALVEGSRSDAGLKAAGQKLAVLTSEYPNSQVAWFNRGWVDAYLRDGKGSIAAWERTAAIDPATSLGKTASGLLARIARAQKAAKKG